MLASFVTLLVILGVLVILACNAGMTGLFMKAPPRGDRAVGLIVPFVGLIIGAVLIVLAGLLAGMGSGRSAVGMLRETPAMSGLVVVLVSIGVVIAAFMAFGAWAEPLLLGPRFNFVKPLIGWTAGIVGPVMLGAALIAGAWMTPQTLGASPKMLLALRASCWMLVTVAAGGYLMAGAVLGRPLVQRVMTSRTALASMSPAERAARERFRSTPVEELLREELDALPSDAPLPDVVRFFVGSTKELDERCREMLVQRALCVPDVDAQLIEVMGSTPYLDRWGGAEMVRHAAPRYIETHRDQWAHAVIAGIDATAEAMSMRPAWLSETFDLNPEPMELVRSLLGAAERFEGTESHARIARSLRGLAEATNELNRDKKRERLAKELARAGYPVPAEQVP